MGRSTPPAVCPGAFEELSIAPLIPRSGPANLPLLLPPSPTFQIHGQKYYGNNVIQLTPAFEAATVIDVILAHY